MSLTKKGTTSKKMKDQCDIYSLILDNIHNGVVVTDPDGYITHFNKPYGKFLKIDPTEQIGKHCTEVIENTRMHIVAQTGVPEINHSQLILGQNMVVQRIPIKKNGTVIAVYGQVMFKNTRDLKKLTSKLSLLESKVKEYEDKINCLRARKFTFDSIVGVSEAMTSLKKEALRAAEYSFPVLITGESGTGKELFAHAIHNASSRKNRPLLRLNCAAVPRELIESELFGYEKGAFTGASSSGKKGKFELAHNSSILLDEIGDMPLEMQPKLLRVIEDKEFTRVGGTAPIYSNFRLIAATNQNLQEMVPEKRFRLDLFYRLNVISLHIPPLRERREDIIPLTHHLLKNIAEEFGFTEISIAPEAEDVLKKSDWPGNTRELLNVLERTISSLDGDTIHIGDLPCYLTNTEPAVKQEVQSGVSGNEEVSLKRLHEQAEREALIQTLHTAGYNKQKAAKILGIHRTLLYKKMKKYHIPLHNNEETPAV